MLKSNQNLQKIVIRKKVFSGPECDYISENMEIRDQQALEVTGDTDYGFANRYMYKNNQETEWIQKRIIQQVKLANEKYFNFKLSYISTLQMFEYTENCFFDWHTDIGGKDQNNFSRKLNVIVFLTPPQNFAGGQLSFNLAELPGVPEVEQEQGTMLIFPSYLPHSVTPVNKGLRQTLTTVIHGDSFR
jgi:predicted 2-oxoglutarate/Fe(II)-dependent dioxygenase YbiX